MHTSEYVGKSRLLLMPDPLSLFVVVVPGLVIVYGVCKWAAKIEARAQTRHEMGCVYYPRRGRKGELSKMKRRPGPGEKADNGFK